MFLLGLHEGVGGGEERLCGVSAEEFDGLDLGSFPCGSGFFEDCSAGGGE